jgi:hypothetical protein
MKIRDNAVYGLHLLSSLDDFSTMTLVPFIGRLDKNPTTKLQKIPTIISGPLEDPNVSRYTHQIGRGPTNGLGVPFVCN